MDSSERIRRMELDGILTAAQAEMLRDSFSTEAPVEGADRRRRTGRVRMILAAGLVAALGLAGLLFGAGTDQAVIQDVATTMNQPGGFGEMNKALTTILALGVLLALPLLIWVWLHNSLVSKEEKVYEAWAQTESNFQRRADLVPVLVDTVSRYLKHESETLTGVTQARSEAVASLSKVVEELVRAQKDSADLLRERGRAVIDEDLDLRALYEAQAKVGRGMTLLVGLAESYPELRSSDQFLELQAQLEGTENRINVARMRFNSSVRDYNRAIRQLPGALVAQVGNFRRKAYFQSEEEARNATELQFQ